MSLPRWYPLLTYLLLPYVLLHLIGRGWRAPDYWQRWRERFGYPRHSRPGVIWLHAVSVGEVQAARPLVRALRERYPQHPLLITTTTPTGSQRVRALFGETVLHCYLPYDLPGAVARFYRRFQPVLGLILETELWPQLLAAGAQRQVPLLLLNARLSPRSARRYAWAPRLTAATLAQLRLIAAQSSADARRFAALGAPKERLHTTGNIKFAIAPYASLKEQAEALRHQWGNNRPAWIAASTHEGEEEVVLEAFARIRQQLPQTLLLLAPRHPERFAKIQQLCRRKGLETVTRSSQQPLTPSTAVFLGDTLGELMLFYAAADVAFVAGSLVPVGGHNPLEPASLGLPILLGPHTFNFEEISQMLQDCGAAQTVHDAASLATAVTQLLTDAPLRAQWGERGQTLVQQNRDALTRTLKLIYPYLDASSA